MLIPILAENDRSRKHGMEEYINADPITFEHHKYFEYLQVQCLDWRLCDPYASLVSSYFSYVCSIYYIQCKKSSNLLWFKNLYKLYSL